MTTPTTRPATGSGASKPSRAPNGAKRQAERPAPHSRPAAALSARRRCGARLGGESGQGRAAAAVGSPGLHFDHADAFIEATRRVPIEHRQIDAQVTARLRDGRDLPQQPAAYIAAARPFADIEILDVKSGATLPGRIVVEEEREAG